MAVPAGMFSAAEIRRHRDSLDTFARAAADFLDWTYADHIAFFERWGVSKYYGNRKPEHRTYELRVRQLRKFGKPVSLADLQVATACITLAMQAVEHGFNATGMASTWKKILNQLKIDQKFYGTDLQLMLQQLGWRIYYWNPDPSKNAAWDAEDQALNPLKPPRKWMPVWGGHALRHASVMNRGIYHETKVDNAAALVGFKTNPPAAFRTVPIFVGIAHAGYHVFPGRRGEVIEAHSMREMTARDNIEFSPFNPLANGGGPRWTRTEKYRSGLIAVPRDF
ncbi:MAG: hypothetical protein N2Z62_08680 [Rhodobacteraceae bacterium]|nr:hypothetical protein [Paracoccaceae bacterium]